MGSESESVLPWRAGLSVLARRRLILGAGAVRTFSLLLLRSEGLLSAPDDAYPEGFDELVAGVATSLSRAEPSGAPALLPGNSISMLGLFLEVSDLVVALPLLWLLLIKGLSGLDLSASSVRTLELLELPKRVCMENSEMLLPSLEPFVRLLCSISGLTLRPGDETVEAVPSVEPLVAPLISLAPGPSSSDTGSRESSQLHEIELLLRAKLLLPLLLELELLLNLR
mmetsp:Transcript_129968/g.243069  ORF Transcript_129968/g.243069 Transcript_129968/m.243069 type:complete len:226 (+) Transcript_129968:1019-1696(+)